MNIYIANMIRSIIPRGLLKVPMAYAPIAYMIMAVKKKPTGTRSVFLSTLPGLTATVIAAIRAVLQMMDPSALPYAISPCPLSALLADTMTSGNVVPMDTTVAPIRSSGTWNLSAIPVAPSTNQSPPLIKRARPTINNRTGTIIILSLLTLQL